MNSENVDVTQTLHWPRDSLVNQLRTRSQPTIRTSLESDEFAERCVALPILVQKEGPNISLADSPGLAVFP